jgi:hypothetical protein
MKGKSFARVMVYEKRDCQSGSIIARALKRDRLQRRIAGIIDAIERGIITLTTKVRLETLEAEKAALERMPVEAPLPAIHPNLAHL